MRAIPLVSALVILTIAWLGPFPALARHSFAAHMTMHMAVVAVAAPLLALAVAMRPFDSAHAWPRFFAPIQASMIELAIVWGWHMPVLHHAARQGGWPLALEQASFLAAGLLLWIAALCGGRERGGGGVVGLLLTSMHMTLLGALFALAPRPLYQHAANASVALSPLADQHLGGAIMLLVGGLSYLAGGLWLTVGLLRTPPKARSEAAS